MFYRLIVCRVGVEGALRRSSSISADTLNTSIGYLGRIDSYHLNLGRKNNDFLARYKGVNVPFDSGHILHQSRRRSLNRAARKLLSRLTILFYVESLSKGKTMA